MNTHKFTGDMSDQVEKDRDELIELRAKCERLEADLAIGEKAIARLEEVESQSAQMREALTKLKHNDGCFCEAFFVMPDGSHPKHSNECELARKALYLDCGKAILARLEEARRLLGQETPWPLVEVLHAAGEAIDHLFQQHDCDHHGWERFKEVRDRLKDYEARATQWLKGGQA